MTEITTLQWIKTNLSPVIIEAVHGSVYPEDLLAGMAMRETGFKLMQLIPKGHKPADLHTMMKGDFGKRPGEAEAQYHGFSYWQIDIASYPEFIASGDWMDPLKSCKKAVSVLDEKKAYLVKQLPDLTGEALENAFTAAYNCGQRNVTKALKAKLSVDHYTFNRDYSKEIRRFRKLYLSL